ncbi:hypothetical protein BVY01_00275 [bacterium I07]|nr:hypothetical protein BVY01_00275 [bacterium I07]
MRSSTLILLISSLLIFSLIPSVLIGQSQFQTGFYGSFGIRSRNIWRGFDLLPDDQPVLQSTIGYKLGLSGLNAKLKVSSALKDRSRLKNRDMVKDLDELLLTIDYSRPGEVLGWRIGINNYYYPRSDRTWDRYSPEIFLGLSLESIILFPKLTFYYDANLGDNFYALLSLGQFIPIGERLFTFRMQLGYNNGQFGVQRGISNIDFQLSTDVYLSSFILRPMVGYVIIPEGTVNSENEIWFGLQLVF